ncbi:tRNA (N(6)-L-threonylcarbamoyladenosine(37)-C(2))-methylthiotransferase MtaB [candidate division KSB1 bacterium]
MKKNEKMSVPVNGAGSVAFSTLGCKVNQVETEELKQALIDNGFRVVGSDQPADFCVVNTCTVTRRSDFESRNLVRRAAKRRGGEGARVIVTGCYAQREGEELLKLPNVAAVIGADRKGRILEVINRLRTETGTIVDIGEAAAAADFRSYPISGLGDRARAFLKVQDGCRGGCSFCIVPSVKGPSRSRTIDDAVAAAGELVERGFRELVVCGIQLGYYGRDLDPEVSLAELLEALTAVEGLGRVRLSSIKPDLVDDHLIDLVSGHPKLCRHIHLSFQSADNTILELMNRNYDADYLEKFLGRLAAAAPDIGLGGDMIVGHPGETESAFENTYSRIEAWPVAFLHVFRYSDRPGTTSSRLPGQVPEDLKKERSRRLRELMREKGRIYAGRFVGREIEVLVEKVEGGLSYGLSDNYLRVEFPGVNRVGELCRVRIRAARDSKLLGEAAE